MFQINLINKIMIISLAMWKLISIIIIIFGLLFGLLYFIDGCVWLYYKITNQPDKIKEEKEYRNQGFDLMN